MTRFPEGDALLAVCRAGRGKLVIVEGESDDEDPWFYGRWFGDLARELTFIPQNGHAKVLQAVCDLRERLSPTHEVFGIRDRDFDGPADWVSQTLAMPESGVLFTYWHTLENYLLVPEGWFKVVAAMHRRLPDSWDSVAALDAQIVDAYRVCLPLAAWNHTVRREYQRLSRDGLRHVEHPKAMPDDPRADLTAWGHQRGAPRPLAEWYEHCLEQLRAAPQAQLPCWVTGKAVLKVFLERFPVESGPRPASGPLVNLYMQLHPHPPDEHVALVRRILAGA